MSRPSPEEEITPASRKRKKWWMTFSRSESPEESMTSEVQAEVEDYLRRCEVLHEEFRQRLRARDNARAELSEAEESIKSLQMEGVSLLSDFSSAMSAADEERLREAERAYKRHSHEIGKAEKHRDRMATELENVEVDEEDAARELKDAVSEVLDEYSQDVRERKQWLAGVMEVLDDQREELGRKAAPLIEEYESRKPPEKLPPAEDPPG